MKLSRINLREYAVDGNPDWMPGPGKSQRRASSPQAKPLRQKIKDDYAAWSGGFEPESEEEINQYIEGSLMTDCDPEMARKVLMQWAAESGNIVPGRHMDPSYSGQVMQPGGFESGSGRIEELESMATQGNAYDDKALFALAHEIAMDDSEPMIVRGRALRVMDFAMGEPLLDIADEEAVAEAVADYVAESG